MLLEETRNSAGERNHEVVNSASIAELFSVGRKWWRAMPPAASPPDKARTLYKTQFLLLFHRLNFTLNGMERSIGDVSLVRHLVMDSNKECTDAQLNLGCRAK
jgi:hypothetical protein